jgi:mannitol-1-phosphate 5-dehydrogenase
MKSLAKKAVIFGAGKIGRSFIGQLFSRGGYEVVFIDVYKPVIDELNHRGNYNVVVKGEQETVMNIKNVRGVVASNEEVVAYEIATAHILAVSIGQLGLKSAITLISKGLELRQIEMYNIPLDIIIAENLRNAAEYFKTELIPLLSATYPFEKLVGLVETSIGKMVPIMLKKDMEEDILQVFGEPYNTLVLDKMAFKNPIPDIAGLAPKENMKAWVDRKLFIHNLGHATVAYLGHLAYPDSIFLFEALSDYQLKEQVRNTMLQAAEILLVKYPEEFTLESLTDHIDDLLRRFQNVALGDTIYRVGCDLQRKLGAEDRIAGAIHLARELNLPYHLILKALVSGCHFNATDEHGKTLQVDIEFRNIYAKGITNVLTSVCGFNEIVDQQVISEARSIDNLLQITSIIAP